MYWGYEDTTILKGYNIPKEPPYYCSEEQRNLALFCEVITFPKKTPTFYTFIRLSGNISLPCEVKNSQGMPHKSGGCNAPEERTAILRNYVILGGCNGPEERKINLGGCKAPGERATILGGYNPPGNAPSFWEVVTLSGNALSI